MYPDIYIRCCIIELYAITFHFPNTFLVQTDENDIHFHKKQIRIRQLFYSILLNKTNQFIKQ